MKEKNPTALFVKKFLSQAQSAKESESDRGLALILCEGLNLALKETAEKCFQHIEDKKIIRALLDDFNGPLGTFSSKIHALYAFEKIGKETFRNLNLMRKIRNSFAHDFSQKDFNCTAVKDRCLQLNIGSLSEGFNDPKSRFQIAYNLVIVGIAKGEDVFDEIKETKDEALTNTEGVNIIFSIP